MNQVRVLIYHRVAGEPEADAVRAAYERVSTELAGVDGMLGNELLHNAFDPASFVVLSRWSSLAAFQEWEQGPAHRDTTAPLRPFRDDTATAPFALYEVVGAHADADDEAGRSDYAHQQAPVPAGTPADPDRIRRVAGRSDGRGHDDQDR